MNYYCIKIGRGAKYITEALKDGFIGIGWGQIPDLKKLGTIEKIREEFQNTSYDYKKQQIIVQSSQLFRFAFVIQNGDYVITPEGNGKYAIGIVGDYYYLEKVKGFCPYQHRRHVKWLESKLYKKDMTASLGYSLGGALTVSSLQGFHEELDSLLKGEKYKSNNKTQGIRELVLNGLNQLDGEEFEHFTKHLLEVLGFTAQTTPYSGDKGVDVKGTLNAESLAEIKLIVQVKRYESSNIGSQIVKQLKGSLSLDEHGCIITTSSFTKDAKEEANVIGHKSIMLIDGFKLCEIVLKHFDNIDDTYKELFSIRKKKVTEIEELFEFDPMED